MRLYNPWPEPYTINPQSPFGPRRDPITGASNSWHHGIDVALPIGTKLVAGAAGTIAHKGSGSSGGYTLIIRHEGNWHTVYYHLKQPSHLNIGDKVEPGQHVATSGNTGRSTGPHLHYELRRSRRWGDTVDPVPFLQGPFRPQASSPIEEPTSAPTAPTRPSRPSRPVKRPVPLAKPVRPTLLARGAQYLRGRGIW